MTAYSTQPQTTSRTLAAGAAEVVPVGEAHGWRLGRLVDPFGHHWEIGRPLPGRVGSSGRSGHRRDHDVRRAESHPDPRPAAPFAGAQDARHGAAVLRRL